MSMDNVRGEGIGDGWVSSGSEPVFFLHTRKMACTREERRNYHMPVLESTEFTTPRSALRHRPIGEDGTQQGKRPIVTSAAMPTTPTPVVRRASRQSSPTPDAEVEVDEWER